MVGRRNQVTTMMAAAVAALLGISAAQTSASFSAPPPESIDATASYYAPGVPTAEPVPGDYSGSLRPQVHFTPPKYFMNDPNGMHRSPDGTYHMYYQYNPLTPVAGNQHWGHATSKDLYTWTNQKIAVWPPNNYTFVFSGSAVIDADNTSGFFPNQTNGVVAMYTLAEYPNGVQGIQYQAIAYSHDGGYTFEAYEGNPVINIGSTQFRDPYVYWYAPGSHWVMVLAHADIFIIEFYTSPNLRDWTAASNFTKRGFLGVQYECPNLLEMPMLGSDEPVWFLQISINPGAPLGGSVSQYFVGSFNGTHFEPFDDAARLTDFAKDAYAGQFIHGIPASEPQIAMNWASNWQYTQLVPTGDESQGEFRSAMGVPRCNHLANVSKRGYDLLSVPCNIEAVYDHELAYNRSLGNGTVLVNFNEVESNALYFEANISGVTNTTLSGAINFTISSSISGEYLRGGSFVGGDIWVDRGHTNGFDNPYFTDKFSATGTFGPGNNGTWGLSMVLDRSIFELFVNSGQQGSTVSFFPTSPLDTLRIDVGGIAPNASAAAAVWALKSTWAPQEDVNGTVRGNVTTTNVTGMAGYGAMRM